MSGFDTHCFDCAHAREAHVRFGPGDCCDDCDGVERFHNFFPPSLIVRGRALVAADEAEDALAARPTSPGGTET